MPRIALDRAGDRWRANTLREVASYARAGHHLVVLDGGRRYADLIVRAVEIGRKANLEELVDRSGLLWSGHTQAQHRDVIDHLSVVARWRRISKPWNAKGAASGLRRCWSSNTDCVETVPSEVTDDCAHAARKARNYRASGICHRLDARVVF
jgi:hypothetical protein